jgi:hypothetical protein
MDTIEKIVAGMLAHNRRDLSVGALVNAVQLGTGVAIDQWALRLNYADGAALLRDMPSVEAIVCQKGAWQVLPALLPTLSDSRWTLASSQRPCPPWVVDATVVISNARQSREALADLCTRPFVSLVVDASPRHDLGLVYVAACDADGQRARCYAFDICATARSEWSGGAHLFGAGHLGRFLSDPRVPKVVCGIGSMHDQVAHEASANLLRTHDIHIPTTVGAVHRPLVRGIVRALPLDAIGVGEDSALREGVMTVFASRGISLGCWEAAGLAPSGDRWHWLRRPLRAHVLANGAERALSLCVAYHCMRSHEKDASLGGTPLGLTTTETTSDSLLCVAAAQTLACAAWSVTDHSLILDDTIFRDPRHIDAADVTTTASAPRALDRDNERVNGSPSTDRKRYDAGTRSDDDDNNNKSNVDEWDDLWRDIQRDMAAAASSQERSKRDRAHHQAASLDKAQMSQSLFDQRQRWAMAADAVNWHGGRGIDHDADLCTASSSLWTFDAARY